MRVRLPIAIVFLAALHGSGARACDPNEECNRPCVSLRPLHPARQRSDLRGAKGNLPSCPTVSEYTRLAFRPRGAASTGGTNGPFGPSITTVHC